MVDIIIFFTPNLPCRTAITGVIQLVVHDAFEITCWPVYLSWLTPMTNVGVMPSSLAGAEMMTFFAPARRCAEAASVVMNRPVDSSTTSTLRSRHGNVDGS